MTTSQQVVPSVISKRSMLFLGRGVVIHYSKPGEMYTKYSIPTIRATCIFMFIAALIITAKKWNQSLRPSTDEWINNMWYIHTMEFYSATIKMKS